MSGADDGEGGDMSERSERIGWQSAIEPHDAGERWVLGARSAAELAA
jgi:hypothetical protein